MLDELIEYKKTRNKRLKFYIAEINTKRMSKELMLKLHLAGFVSIQIGLEALSDSLLMKMKKESRFINHLLTIKFANKFNVYFLGANLIKGTLDESDDDVIESINNLPYLRFYYTNGFIPITLPLAIKYSSKYYQRIKEDNTLDDYEYDLDMLLPNSLKAEKIYFFDHIKIKFISLWNILIIQRAFIYLINLPTR